jgi:hypothetical protein
MKWLKITLVWIGAIIFGVISWLLVNSAESGITQYPEQRIGILKWLPETILFLIAFFLTIYIKNKGER